MITLNSLLSRGLAGIQPIKVEGIENVSFLFISLCLSVPSQLLLGGAFCVPWIELTAWDSCWKAVHILEFEGGYRLKPLTTSVCFLWYSQVDVTDVIDAHSSYLWGAQQILDLLELEAYYPVFRSTICIQWNCNVTTTTRPFPGLRGGRRRTPGGSSFLFPYLVTPSMSVFHILLLRERKCVSNAWIKCVHIMRYLALLVMSLCCVPFACILFDKAGYLHLTSFKQKVSGQTRVGQLDRAVSPTICTQVRILCTQVRIHLPYIRLI